MQFVEVNGMLSRKRDSSLHFVRHRGGSEHGISARSIYQRSDSEFLIVISALWLRSLGRLRCCLWCRVNGRTPGKQGRRCIPQEFSAIDRSWHESSFPPRYLGKSSAVAALDLPL